MSFKKSFKQLVKACDLFAKPVTFRYSDQPEYESLTGGTISIALIIVFIAVFTNTVMNTINRIDISSSTTRLQEEDPSYYKVGTDSFMFALGISDIDLNADVKWFDVSMEKRTYTADVKAKEILNLQKCDKSQWTRIGQKLGATFDKLKFDTWLCPTPETIIELQGKFTSDMFKFYKFGVKKCSSKSEPNRTCVSAATIENYLNSKESFTLNFYYINTVMNPNSQQPLSYYLDDTNYFPFTPTDGMTVNFFLSSYVMSTDESISPVNDIQKVHGGISVVPTQMIGYSVRQTQYMKFYIRKSSLSLEIDRAYKKVDDTLSYIGGLFSTILAGLFMIGMFNEFGYELDIAKNLYHYEKNTPLQSEQFNFLIYMVFEKFGIDLPWKKMRIYHHSLEEVRKQMDIRLIMKKILYSERMAIAVFDEPKAKLLHLQEPLTLDEAEEIRKDHRFYQKLEDRYFDYEALKKQSQQAQDSHLSPPVSPIAYPESTERGTSNLLKMFTSCKVSNQSGFSNEPEVKSSDASNINPFFIPDSVRSEGGENEEIPEKPKKRQPRSSCVERREKEVINILSMFVQEKDKKEAEFKKNIQQMKGYLEILKKEAEQGDVISQKILKRFDQKLIDAIEKEEKAEKEPASSLQTENPTSQQMKSLTLESFVINLNPPHAQPAEPEEPPKILPKVRAKPRYMSSFGPK